MSGFPFPQNEQQEKIRGLQCSLAGSIVKREDYLVSFQFGWKKFLYCATLYKSPMGRWP